MASGSSFSALQKNLQLAYCNNPDDQHLAAENLAKLVSNTTFPVVSFGPLAHALCRYVETTCVCVCVCVCVSVCVCVCALPSH